MTDKPEPRLHGTYVEFDSVDKLIPACRRIRDAGYTKTDAFTPFPVHGIDKALGIKSTHLPWISLVCGLTGTSIALAMQIWMNSLNYPYIISGKPYISLPAFIPVTFELTVLLASFGAFFGMLALNKLPRFSNPVFTDPRFDRATDDRFFLFIDAKDAKYDQNGIASLFNDLGGNHVDHILEDTSSNKIPKPFIVGLMLLALLATVPPLVLARMLVTNSGSPRYHVVFDMDFSPSKDAQQITTLFADGRAARPDVPGTVAVGQYDEALDFYTGIDMEELSQRDAPRATRLVRALLNGADPQQAAEPQDPQAAEPQDQEAAAPQPAAKADPPAAGGPDAETKPAAAADHAAAAPATAVDTTPWLKENPLASTSAVLERGRQQFEIYCAVCHGNDGRGNGLVNRRAQRLLASAWVQPSSMHQDTLYADQYADGKLFNTISNGIRKMPGYAGQISTRDRWSVVAYVRALQASQNASLEDLPADKRDEIQRQQAEVKKRLAAEAEQEKKRAEQAEQEKKKAEQAEQEKKSAEQAAKKS